LLATRRCCVDVGRDWLRGLVVVMSRAQAASAETENGELVVRTSPRPIGNSLLCETAPGVFFVAPSQSLLPVLEACVALVHENWTTVDYTSSLIRAGSGPTALRARCARARAVSVTSNICLIDPLSSIKSYMCRCCLHVAAPEPSRLKPIEVKVSAHCR
jgi:hypothetical protein